MDFSFTIFFSRALQVATRSSVQELGRGIRGCSEFLVHCCCSGIYDQKLRLILVGGMTDCDGLIV